MGFSSSDDSTFDNQIATRLRSLRAERNCSLDELARLSGVSRATLSRLENAEVSPTAAVLGRLCAAYGMTMSRLMRMVEDAFAPVVRRDEQWVWSDPQTGFERRSVSPPNAALAGEVIQGTLPPGTSIIYPEASKPGLEHHLVLLEGQLTLTIGGRAHDLSAGDCLRYQLYGATEFATPDDCGARYLLFMV
ncbi:helix-turn-helix domain-containing protein [Rhizobium sp. TH2]|uniref:helix-turn-helix domain-containing protein n=1 Tax=Rhizobium sp. TH2 TaxID=2775403 RepID=UPI002156FA14|nr:helix-turn-helix transcriptional regulator [Rhizobium sp. TH2]UVC06715.1 helix-turn-helix domain-containing protein [Rhizobium sp. TH2]